MDVRSENYIQWALKDDTETKELIGNYFRQKNNNLNNARFNIYSKMIKNKFENNQQNLNSYLQLVRSVVKDSNFSTALDNAINKLPMPTLSNFDLLQRETQEQLINSAEDFDKLVNEIKVALGAIVRIMETENLIGVNPETITLLQELGISSDGAFLNLRQNAQTERALQGQYKWLLSQLPDFKDAISGNRIDSIKVLSKILIPIQTIIGFASEHQLSNEINEIEKNLILGLQGISGITATVVGNNPGSNKGQNSFKFQTSDLSLSFTNEKGEAIFNIPSFGVSLKRSRKNLGTAEFVRIKLKRSTYGKLLQEAPPRMKTIFYTLYAYANKNYPLNSLGEEALENAYQTMKIYATITGLVGNLDAEDLAFVFVLNNKAITIFDLLESMKSDADSRSFELLPEFSKQRGRIQKQHISFYSKTSKGANGRSNKIRKAIDHISAQVYLFLTKEQLKKII